MVAKTLGYDINTLTLIAFIGVVIKLFLGQGPRKDGSGGPANSAIWGYGTIAIAILGIMFVTFGLATQMTEDNEKSKAMGRLQENTLGFVKSLMMHSLPPLLMLIILVWLITLNVKYFSRINQGKVASEYSSYSNLSTVMVVIQLICLYQYLVDELKINEGGLPSSKAVADAMKSQLASVTYLLTLGNVMVIGIMTIILKYFSTDG